MIKNRTLRVIIILVALLFLNIEAAQAGLVYKIRVYFRHEFPDQHLLAWSFVCICIVAFLIYVVFASVLIGNQKWDWLNYYSYQPNRHNYQSKRVAIQKITGI